MPLERVGTRPAAGTVDVRYGRSTGVSGTNAQGWTQDSPGVSGQVESFDRFATSLAR